MNRPKAPDENIYLKKVLSEKMKHNDPEKKIGHHNLERDESMVDIF